MGYNATVVILIDQLDQIEKDPEFGKKLAAAIKSYRHTDKGRMPFVTGQTEVVCVEHADYMQIVAVGGNTGRRIGFAHYTSTDDEIIDRLVDDRKRRKKENAGV